MPDTGNTDKLEDMLDKEKTNTVTSKPWYKKPVVWVSALVVVGLVVAGVFWWSDANSKKSTNARWDQAAQTLFDDTAVLLDDTASLEALTNELQGRLDLPADEVRAADAVIASSTALVDDLTRSVPAFTQADPGTGNTAHKATAVAPPDFLATLQTEDPQSKGSQSEGSQLGDVGPVPFATIINELWPTTDDPQSEDAQSEGPQSGEDLVVETAETVSLSMVADGTQKTGEDIEALEGWNTKVVEQTDLVRSVAVSLVYSAYQVAWEEALANESLAFDNLTAAIDSAAKTLADSKGKVADDQVRSDLEKAVKNAQAITLAGPEATLSQVLESTVRIKETALSLNAPVKTVTDAVAAKAKADAEAKAKAEAAAAAEAARQNNNTAPNNNWDNNNNNYYQPDTSNNWGNGNGNGSGNNGNGNSGNNGPTINRPTPSKPGVGVNPDQPGCMVDGEPGPC